MRIALEFVGGKRFSRRVDVWFILSTAFFTLWTALGWVSAYRQSSRDVIAATASDPSAVSWSTWFWAASPADWLLTIVGIGTLLGALQTLRALGLQVDTNIDAANAAKDAATAARDTLATNQEIERAYISMSHRDVVVDFAPDGQEGWDLTHPIAVHLEVEIRNNGRTPGDLLGGFFGWVIDYEPRIPSLGHAINPLTGAFLLPDGFVNFGFELNQEHTLNLAHAIHGYGGLGLWLIAQIDYVDRFGHPHTGGYGRRYATNPVGPSFVFSGDTAAFNYDRPMTADKRRHYQLPSESN